MSDTEKHSLAERQSSVPADTAVTIYSAPRRFDLATMLAVTTAYALMFALLRTMDAGGNMILWAGTGVTLVGIGQAILFGSKSPRLSSMLVGAVVMSLSILFLTGHSFTFGRWLFAWTFGTMLGVPAGYLAGALIGGVFLIAHAIRRRLDR